MYSYVYQYIYELYVRELVAAQHYGGERSQLAAKVKYIKNKVLGMEKKQQISEKVAVSDTPNVRTKRLTLLPYIYINILTMVYPLSYSNFSIYRHVYNYSPDGRQLLVFAYRLPITKKKKKTPNNFFVQNYYFLLLPSSTIYTGQLVGSFSSLVSNEFIIVHQWYEYNNNMCDEIEIMRLI